MHSVAVDGSSVPSAFLSHHQPPSSTCRRRHTLLPSPLSNRAAISQPPWQDAASPLLLRQKEREPPSPRCGCGSSTSQVDAPRRGETTQQLGPAASDRSPVLLRSGTEAKQNLQKSVCTRNDFNAVVLISLLIWRTPPNV